MVDHKHILVVDDEPQITRGLRTTLSSHGYDIRVANDGETAYGHLKDPKCRAMLLDIRMPGINGAELLMLMTAEGIKVPVIVMAGFPDFDEEEMKQFPNVKKMFHKPLYPEDVLASVREFARK